MILFAFAVEVAFSQLHIRVEIILDKSVAERIVKTLVRFRNARSKRIGKHYIVVKSVIVARYMRGAVGAVVVIILRNTRIRRLFYTQ